MWRDPHISGGNPEKRKGLASPFAFDCKKKKYSGRETKKKIKKILNQVRKAEQRSEENGKRKEVGIEISVE